MNTYTMASSRWKWLRLCPTRRARRARTPTATLSGCRHVSDPRFVAYDLIGSLAYAVLWVVRTLEARCDERDAA